jgi:hypothetical protein
VKGGEECETNIIMAGGGGGDDKISCAACASTAAPPIITPGLEASSSAGSSGFAMTAEDGTMEGISGGEEDAETCPKVSGANTKMKGGVDGPLMAQRSSPYAKPQGENIHQYICNLIVIVVR